MLYPIWWAMIESHPVIAYFVTGFLCCCYLAYVEGRDDQKELGGEIFGCFFTWPVFVFVYVLYLAGSLFEFLFKAGKAVKK